MKLKRKTEGVADHHYSARYPGSRILPIDNPPEGLRPNTDLVLPETFFLVDAAGEFLQMFTVMPDGVITAWSVCQSCSKWVPQCVCPHGFSVTRGIEYIYDQTRALMAGEEWGPRHTCYLGGLREKRLAYWRLGRRTTEEVSPEIRKPLPRKQTDVGAVQKKLRTKGADQRTADADVSKLVSEKLGQHRKLKRKRIE